MLWIPGVSPTLVETNVGSVGSSTLGTAVQTGASASTKTSPAVQLIASTLFDAYWIKIIATNYANATTASQGALDILIGAATEEMLIPNLLMGHCGHAGAQTACGAKVWEFPLFIPAGSRLAAASAGARTSTDVNVAVYLYGGAGYPPYRVGQKVVTYGMGTVPDGTTVTPGASGAEGSWTQITASTTENHIALIPSIQPTGDTTVLNRAYSVDVGIGASSAEVDVGIPWVYFTEATFDSMMSVESMSKQLFVPSGTRLAMRISNSGTNDSTINGVIHAVTE